MSLNGGRTEWVLDKFCIVTVSEGADKSLLTSLGSGSNSDDDDDDDDDDKEDKSIFGGEGDEDYYEQLVTHITLIRKRVFFFYVHYV